MIVLDTHIWVWWVHGDERISSSQAEAIEANEDKEIGISAISLWEIAKLVENNRLELPVPLEKWFEQALSYPGIRIIELTPEIVTESTRLPGKFHKDPADQIIVATARVMKCSLITSDDRILGYPHVKTEG
ncbi:MAG: PIN domain nuclease [Anaerolineae bacterium]|nr:type II toxin-antitoxin system VapC family toxin [Anaerolineales bacterium]RIK31403.1 MAG: PIN domain nuclease [Anaerolineae bacterium]WKZ43940.1 MAG: type II toxin-antitoxin system VapC family toxin [Anaerolineales bacterium]